MSTWWRILSYLVALVIGFYFLPTLSVKALLIIAIGIIFFFGSVITEGLSAIVTVLSRLKEHLIPPEDESV